MLATYWTDGRGRLEAADAADRSIRKGAYILEEFQLYGFDGTRFLWPLVQNFRNGDYGVTVISFFRFQTNKNAVEGSINQQDIGEWLNNLLTTTSTGKKLGRVLRVRISEVLHSLSSSFLFLLSVLLLLL